MVDLFIGVFFESWEVLVESAPYVLFGFFAAGILKAYLPEQMVAKHLGKNSTSSVLKAALFGIPLPLCSCGVIPAAIELRKQGASKGASASFLVSVPETGVDSIAITWALLDPV
ncbi:Predicted permease, partial [Malonomonas rubra DSM 5091]